MKKKKKKIIIIGGTGFLGYHFAKLCIKKKFKVISFSRNKPIKKRRLNNVDYLYGDITIKSQISKKLKRHLGAEYLVNFGGEVDHKNINKTFKSHFFGVKNLSKLFSNKNLKKFIQVGSSLEYGKLPSPHIEETNPKPISNYGKAKYFATKYLMDLYKKKNFPVVVIRPYQIYGPYQDNNRLIPIVIKSSLQNIKFSCSDGKQFRDFLYIEDFIKFIFLLINKKTNNGQIFNVGCGRAYKVKKIITFINSYIKKGKPIFGEIKLRNEENLVTFPKIKKAKKLLNWKPKTSFKNGIIKTINYYKKNI